MAELKIAVRYFSKSGNTKKVAEAIAQAAGCELKPIPEPINGDVDILFLGASVYWGGVASEVKDYIPGLNKNKIGKVVIFSTSALAQRAFPSIKKSLQKQGITVDEDNFYCHGQGLGLHKNRPNEEDLTAAVKFTKDKLKG
ncbi:MAG: flavodoxin [Clostridia bacterium]|nr:flavodoxin [Clostridia bacterium]